MNIIISLLAVLLHTCYADRLVIDAPSSIQLENQDAEFDSNEVSGLVTYLMGFSSSWNRYIQGFSTDMMKAPKANLFISVLDENFSAKNFQKENSFVINNSNNIIPSMQELHDGIIKNFGKKSLVIEDSLTNHPSMFKNWDGKNIIDLITILQSDPELTRLCSDTYPDSFKFILNKNNNWQSDIESIISSFKNLYKDDILVEILFTNANNQEVHSRQKRHTTDSSEIKGLVEPNKRDQIIALNLCIWTTFFIFVVVLFTSYSIWFMDPGMDSIIYKTTNFRIKSD